MLRLVEFDLRAERVQVELAAARDASFDGFENCGMTAAAKIATITTTIKTSTSANPACFCDAIMFFVVSIG